MRTLLLTAIVSGLIAASSPVEAQPTSPSANASRYGIGVVDISYVFKKYSRFTTAMESIKQEMQKVESQLKSERDTIQAKEEQARQYNPSSPEYKQLDEDVARLKAELQLKVGRVRKDILEREAKVYYQTYLEVTQAVQYYAQQHNLGLVLRFDGNPIDPNNPKAILQGINKNVVHQNGIDITPDVLSLLERGGTAGGVAPSANAGQNKRR
ncbi:MAG: OmpH family outer membrane protein [Pirellulales bacterium]|nr:OmpH family outer membrane protein [Pirellulales bacterium]